MNILLYNQVAGVCSSRNFELLRGLGVTELYNYSDPTDINQLLSQNRYTIN